MSKKQSSLDSFFSSKNEEDMKSVDAKDSSPNHKDPHLEINNDLNWINASVVNLTGFYWNESSDGLTIHLVNQSQNVGIGTNDSEEKLNVVGDVNVTNNFWVDFKTFFVQQYFAF